MIAKMIKEIDELLNECFNSKETFTDHQRVTIGLIRLRDKYKNKNNIE